MLRYSKSREQGFTLVELMAVLFIISILVGVVIYVNPFAQDDALVTATKLQINELCKAIEECKSKNGNKYPDSLDELISKKILSEIPKDGWGNDFVYIKGGTYNGAKQYDLISLGADNAEGGTGYDADIINKHFKKTTDPDE